MATYTHIPLAKLRKLQAHITDKSGADYQRITWEVLRKSIRRYISEVNTSNIKIIAWKLMTRVNIIRGQGLFSLSIVQAQAASPSLTPVYAGLVAMINSKYAFSKVSPLVLEQICVELNYGLELNHKGVCITSGIFLAHLFNHGIVCLLGLVVTLLQLLKKSTNDCVEAVIVILKECGGKLMETKTSRRGLSYVLRRLREIFDKGQLNERVQHMIKDMFPIREDSFKDYKAVLAELNLVEEEKQRCHLVAIISSHDYEKHLQNEYEFKFDANYLNSEESFKQLRKEVFGNDVSDGSEDDDEEESLDYESGILEGGENQSPVKTIHEDNNVTTSNNKTTNSELHKCQ